MADRTILLTGSKGGVGTSTVALNLGVQLANATKKRVALVDLARPFGQISLMLDVEPRFTVLDALERIERLDERLLSSMAVWHKTGIEILAGPLQAPMKTEQRQSVTIEALCQLVEMANKTYDFVIVDVGVVNAAEWAEVLRKAQVILLVSEPSVLAMGMIKRHMAAAAPAGVDCSRIRIVINRCSPNDDAMIAAFEQREGHEVLVRLPNDYRQLTDAVSLRMPLTGSANNVLLARYRTLAQWTAANVLGTVPAAT